MSLTTEFQEAIAQIAEALGEGLTATLIHFGADGPGYDPGSQSYGSATPVEQTFACSPVAERRGSASGSPEVLRGSLQLIIPTTDSAGESIEPVVGDRVRVGSVIYQIATVVPLNIGTGIAGYECEVRQ